MGMKSPRECVRLVCRGTVRTARRAVRRMRVLRRQRGSVVRSMLRRYLDAHQVRKLQIGASDNLLPGWLNTDLSPWAAGTCFLDASKDFPFPDETWDYIFCEHVIEHLSFEDGLAMLRRCFRALRPGGTLRMSTPNLAAFVGMYNNNDERSERYVRWCVDRPEHKLPAGKYSPVVAINTMLSGFGHRFVYDLATLMEALENAGFDSIIVCESGKSEDPVLRNIEWHGKVIGEEWNAFESIVVEARKKGGDTPPAERVRSQVTPLDRDARLHVVFYDWPATRGNHTGLAHLFRRLADHFGASVELVEIPSGYGDWCNARRKLYRWRVTQGIKKSLRAGDCIFLTEYLGGRRPGEQRLLAMELRKEGIQSRIVGLAHLPGRMYNDLYSPQYVHSALHAVDEVFVLGSSLAQYFSELGWAHKTTGTFLYADTEYYRPGTRDEPSELRVISMGYLGRDTGTMKEIVARSPTGICYTICAGTE